MATILEEEEIVSILPCNSVIAMLEELRKADERSVRAGGGGGSAHVCRNAPVWAKVGPSGTSCRCFGTGTWSITDTTRAIPVDHHLAPVIRESAGPFRCHACRHTEF
ncbi:hypothetical protein V5799_005396 [Amblyomma americanum]|uniref:Uncharacterized protein n=1 Tax=Amblyomma americanum TaxID=6943 RepID=A0AAQ4DZD3_AMBAM